MKKKVLLSFFLVFVNISSLFCSIAKEDAAVINITGEITPVTAYFVKASLNDAIERGVKLIIVNINTPGGDLAATLDIAKILNAASNPDVYAYIEDTAWSGGAFIAFACDKIYMQEGSSIGSAEPISLPRGTRLGEKFVSAVRGKIESIAEANGYNKDIAAAMVDADIALKIKEEGGFKTVSCLSGEANEDNGKVLITKGKLLNLPAKEAFDLGIASGLFKSLREFEKNIGVNVVKVYNPGINEKIVSFLTSKLLVWSLFIFAFFFLYVEAHTPGLGLGLILSLTSFAVIFIGQYLLNNVNMVDMVFLVVGAFLIFIELFFIPGFGIFGALGILSLFSGLVLMLVPDTGRSGPVFAGDLESALLIVLGSFFVSLIFGLFLLANIEKIPFLNKFVLKGTLKDVKTDETSDGGGLKVGDKGIAFTPLRPIGKGKFGNKYYDVVADAGMIEKDSVIEVVKIENLDVVVRKIN